MKPSLTQKRNASRKVTGAGARVSTGGTGSAMKVRCSVHVTTVTSDPDWRVLTHNGSSFRTTSDVAGVSERRGDRPRCGDTVFGRDLWLAKSDTLGPLGPCIVTLDEIANPDTLRIRSWQNDQPRQDFSSAEASYTIGQQVELATTVMTLFTGDVIACGTSPNG